MNETGEQELDPTLADQPHEWQVVFREVKTLDDALALMGLYEYRDDMLYANDLPIDAFHRDWALLGERSLSDWLATYLRKAHGLVVDYVEIMSSTRSRDPDTGDMDVFIARCRVAGVELTHRPDPPTPWRVVAATVASEVDAAAYHALTQEYFANNWWFDLDDVPAPPVPATPATPAQLADFIARCRRAGVVLTR